MHPFMKCHGIFEFKILQGRYEQARKKTTFVWHIRLSFFLFLVFKFRCERLLFIRGFCRQFVFCCCFFLLVSGYSNKLHSSHSPHVFHCLCILLKSERNKTKYQKKCRNKNNNNNNDDTPIRAAAEKYTTKTMNTYFEVPHFERGWH